MIKNHRQTAERSFVLYFENFYHVSVFYFPCVQASHFQSSDCQERAGGHPGRGEIAHTNQRAKQRDDLHETPVGSEVGIRWTTLR